MGYNGMNQEPYHAYIGRRLKEEGFGDEKTIDERDNEIFELKRRISKLESDIDKYLFQRHE